MPLCFSESRVCIAYPSCPQFIFLWTLSHFHTQGDLQTLLHHRFSIYPVGYFIRVKRFLGIRKGFLRVVIKDITPKF